MKKLYTLLSTVPTDGAIINYSLLLFASRRMLPPLCRRGTTAGGGNYFCKLFGLGRYAKEVVSTFVDCRPNTLTIVTQLSVSNAQTPLLRLIEDKSCRGMCC